MMDSPPHKYTAFISYNSRDDKWAKWLQGKLEGFSLPSIIANDKGEVVRKYDHRPAKFKIFRYVSDLVATSLASGLSRELDQSANLIVICSPHSAESEWVGREIRHFAETGRKDHIIPFIIDGTPYSGDERECFHPVLKELFPGQDMLGVNLNDTGDDSALFKRRKAVAKVVSLLIDTPDAYHFIWNRYRRKIKRRVLIGVAVIAFVALMILTAIRYSRPFDCDLTVCEAPSCNAFLPGLEESEVMVYLEDDIRSFQSVGAIPLQNIPHRLMGKNVRIVVTPPSPFMLLDTTVLLGRKNTVHVHRNEDYYGRIHFTLYREETGQRLPGVWVEIAGRRLVSGLDGTVVADIPLPDQRTQYPILCEVPLVDTLLFPPTTEYTAIFAR